VEAKETVTTLSLRRQCPVDSTRTGLGPGPCVLTPVALANALGVRHPQAARLYPIARAAARYAGRATAWSEAREDAPPWDAA
jgi:hypothetical protein